MRREGAPDGPLSPLGLVVVGLILGIDQIAKEIAEARLPLGEAIPVLPILDLFRVHNTGIAFSMLAGHAGLGLIGLTLVISAGVLIFWWRAADGGRPATVGYGLILGGALGNLADRVFRGHVVDFLLLHLGDWTLFVFNLADTALTFGPVVLFLVYWRRAE